MKRYSKKIIHDIKSIFFKAIEKVDPFIIIKDHVNIENQKLKIEVENRTLSLDLEQFDRIVVLGTGKATARMAKAVEDIFKERIDSGVISVKYGFKEKFKRIQTIEAGHPVPDENSLRAARSLKQIAESADENTLVINLISGGGSSLLAFPMECSFQNKKITLSLQELQQTTEALLASGATINEINCVRKHIELLKGGRFVRLIYPAVSVNLILSDVIGDRLDTIASGITSPDNTTYQDALKILEKYDLTKKIPENIYRVLEAGEKGLIEETPRSGDFVFSKVHNFIVGSNYLALISAKDEAVKRGYNTTLLSSMITGEAREGAKFFYSVAREIRKHGLPIQPPACILAGGETTVTLTGKGKGGRNQEMALSFLCEWIKYGNKDDNLYFFPAATDGNDGPTDAAGAFVSGSILDCAFKKSLYPEDFLKNNDSYNFFYKTGALFKPGPTNTNVCDLYITIVP